MWVTKYDGSRQEFDKEKVIRTCTKMTATQKEAEKIAKKIEKQIYNGITTKKIFQLVFKYLREYKPEIAHRIDLRESISLLRPKPDFEWFVQLLLQELGYEVLPNQIVRGACVPHEVDAIAKNSKETIYVEVKHHFQHHTYTGVDECLETHARFEDLSDGYNLGLAKIKFDRAMIICNTKFSDNAKQYAACKKISLIGWKTPEERGLEQMIEEKKFYPITFMKDISKETRERLADNGIVLLKQLVVADSELHKKIGISKGKFKEIVNIAKKFLVSKKIEKIS